MNFFVEAYTVGVANTESKTPVTTSPTIRTARIVRFDQCFPTVLGSVDVGMPLFIAKACKHVLGGELLDKICSALRSRRPVTP